ncbi:MAG: hypothetical protein QNJ72_39110 [Pleurocapsa sp. MO_226.B13]|nr:hypothetical protein [Pleurocapsa sp. MO_226.B13]
MYLSHYAQRYLEYALEGYLHDAIALTKQLHLAKFLLPYTQSVSLIARLFRSLRNEYGSIAQPVTHRWLGLSFISF